MDYAKMAYLKVEDLARRIEGLEQATVYPYGVSLVSTTTGSATVSAKRQVACSIIVRVRLTVATAGQVALTLTVGGVRAFDATYSLGAGTQDVFFLASAVLTKGANPVSVTVQGASLLLCELMTFGEAVSAQDGVRMSATADHVVVCDSNEARLFRAEGLAPVITLPARVASLYEGADATRLLLCDGEGLWRMSLNTTGVSRAERIGEAVDDACGYFDGADEGVVTVRSGRVSVDGATLDGVRDAVGIVGVYGARPPAFVLWDNAGKMTYRTALARTPAGRAV